jgi:hypothetical protein
MPQKVGTEMSESQIQTQWTTLKADLATATATFQTLLTQLATVEADCVLMNTFGGQDVVQWVQTQLRQLTAGYQAYPVPGGAAVIQTFAVDPNSPRQINAVDPRPISAIHPGLT